KGSGQECPLYTNLGCFLCVLELDDLKGCLQEVGGNFSSLGRGLRECWSAFAGSAKDPHRSADVESPPSQNEGWGTPLQISGPKAGPSPSAQLRGRMTIVSAGSRGRLT